MTEWTRYRRTEWLWLILGGFYLLVYSYWYLPALNEFPASITDPPAQYPWHWPLDLVATAVPGVVLLIAGFRRATAIATPARMERETNHVALPGDE